MLSLTSRLLRFSAISWAGDSTSTQTGTSGTSWLFRSMRRPLLVKSLRWQRKMLRLIMAKMSLIWPPDFKPIESSLVKRAIGTPPASALNLIKIVAQAVTIGLLLLTKVTSLRSASTLSPSKRSLRVSRTSRKELISYKLHHLLRPDLKPNRTVRIPVSAPALISCLWTLIKDSWSRKPWVLGVMRRLQSKKWLQRFATRCSSQLRSAPVDADTSTW